MKNFVLLTGLTFGLLSPAFVFAQDAGDVTGDLAVASADGTIPADAVIATGDPEAIRIAEEANACGELILISAVYNENGEVAATCGEVTAFVPLLGGFAPALGAAGLAGVLAAAGGGSGPVQTK